MLGLNINPNLMDRRNKVALSGIETNSGGEFKISLRLAVLLQLVMMAAGAGATYTATRAAIDADRQKIVEQSQAIRQLELTTIETQKTLASLTTTIEYQTRQITSMQERLWNDRRH